MTVSWTGFARELRRRRAHAGLTLRELAERTSVALNTVARLESGNRRPSIDLLERLAGALGCRVRDLLPEDRRRKR